MSTGKTTILLGRARELALRGEPVLVVVCNIFTDVKSLLHLELEARFREEGINIEVTMRQKAVTSLYLDTVQCSMGKGELSPDLRIELSPQYGITSKLPM